MNAAIVHAVIDDLGSLLLFTMILIVGASQISRAIYAVAGQSLLIAIAGAVLAKATGKKQAELIREAVDQFVELASGSRREAALNQAAGIWRERKDLPDFAEIRQSLDRS